jgi:tripeptide aminopeptidase
MIQRDRLIRQFLELVQIGSHSRDERRIADALTQRLRSLGLAVREDQAAVQVGGNAGNITAVMRGDPDRRRLLFTAHMDTVRPGEGVRPRVQEGRITSDGTTVLGADDKAGIAGILEMLAVIRERGLAHGDIQVLFTVCEEIGLQGSKHLDPSWLQADFGFAFDAEGPLGHVVIQAPQQARLEAVVHGRPAHDGTRPGIGISAISVASRAIAKMKLGRVDRETTANIGSFRGESPTNGVCSRVEIVAEARSLDPRKLDRQLDHMRHCFEQAAVDQVAAAEVRIEHMYSGYRFAETDEIAVLAAKALAGLGREAEFVASGSGSDANHLNFHGLATVNLAIGYERIHTTEEFIRLDDLADAAELMVSLTQIA